MQCKDIPDRDVLLAIEMTRGTKGFGVKLDNWRSRDDLLVVLTMVLGYELPFKLYWAKLGGMKRRGLIDACCVNDHSGRRPRSACSGRIHLIEECQGEACGA